VSLWSVIVAIAPPAVAMSACWPADIIRLR
jgi:hypothetical protein